MPPTVWFLVAGTFINRFGSFVVTFLVLYLTKAGFSSAQAGMALASYGAGSFAASIAGGYLADRAGRRNTIAASMFSSAVTMLALSQLHAFPLIVLFSALAGLTSELYRPAASALIADVVAQEQRVTAYALYRLAINAGVAAGPALAGFLADKSFELIFIGDAATSVLYGVFALFALPHGVRSAKSESSWMEAIRSAVHDKAFLFFLAGTTCVTLVDFQMSATFALHVRDQNFSSAVYGALISLNGAIIIATEIFLTNVAQRFRRTYVIATGYLLCGLGFALNTVATTRMALVMVILVFTIGEMISAAVSAAFVADASPAHLRGRYMGLYGFTWSFGMTVGPAGGALIYDRSPHLVWLLCGLFGIAAALLVLQAGRLMTKKASTA